MFRFIRDELFSETEEKPCVHKNATFNGYEMDLNLSCPKECCDEPGEQHCCRRSNLERRPPTAQHTCGTPGTTMSGPYATGANAPDQGKDVCVLRYTREHGSDIKNITFRCEYGCCGTESREYCCLSAPTLLGAIFTAALFGILCVIAISDYLYKKCHKNSTTARTAGQINGPVPTYHVPFKKQIYLTTVCRSVLLTQYVEAQPYPYFGTTCYTYPLVHSYHGPLFATQLPAPLKNGGPDTSNPVNVRAFNYLPLGAPDASEPSPYTYTIGSHTPKVSTYTNMASPVGKPVVHPLMGDPETPNLRQPYSSVRIPSAPPVTACGQPKDSKI